MAKINDKTKGKKPVDEAKANAKKGSPAKAAPKNAKTAPRNAKADKKTANKPTETRKKK